MSIKKKLGMGAMSAVLGLSLIGGGTFAYFNDTATINNAFAAGTLDLVIDDVQNEEINFDLANLKPGDTMNRRFYLRNGGTLAIKEVLLDARADSFSDPQGDSTMMDFLNQFRIDVLRVQSGDHPNANSIIIDGEVLTLADLVSGADLTSKIKAVNLVGNRINIASPAGTNGEGGVTVDPVDQDIVVFHITFHDDGTDQNRFQGDAVRFYFDLEATQWSGVNIGIKDPNGVVQNGKEKSSDGGSQPNPITDGGPTGSGITEAVTD